MCLTTVTKRFTPNDNIIMGYKIMMRSKKDNLYLTAVRNKNMVEGEAYKANNITIYADTGEEYDSGFHIFKYKKDIFTKYKDYYFWNFNSRLYTFCKVLAWDIRAEGLEGDSKIIIAKNIRIMEEI